MHGKLEAAAPLMLAGMVPLLVMGARPAAAALGPDPARTGREIYEATCAACHGVDGRGVSRTQVGFDAPLPDFTDCGFASREPDADWVAVAHDVRQHVFRGGNFFVPRIFNLYRRELAVQARSGERDAMIEATERFLGTRAARVDVFAPTLEAGRVAFDVRVTNLAGHKLPTAYPSRRAWIHVTVTDAAGAVVFESGAPRPDGSIVGNDNDVDGTAYEPHYRTIARPDQVQVYEAIMVDYRGEVTTGLVYGVEFVKDNRVLPRGFEKATAGPDIAVQGDAADDPDFRAPGDRVRYDVDVGDAPGPFRVRARLLYQPIGFRWDPEPGGVRRGGDEPLRPVL